MAAFAAVATAAAGVVRWVNHRRHPVPESIEPVKFSGRTREAFLERVWSQRIVSGLERSIQHAAKMYLGLRNSPELVKLSYSQSMAEPGEVLGIETAYEQVGGQLVIVGPPGSGKTTEALKLMRHLLEAHAPSSRSGPPRPLGPGARDLPPWVLGQGAQADPRVAG